LRNKNAVTSNVVASAAGRAMNTPVIPHKAENSNINAIINKNPLHRAIMPDSGVKDNYPSP